MPEVYAELERIGRQLEKHYRDVQDLEFTIERGQPVHAADALREAHRRGRRQDRRRHGRGRADHARKKPSRASSRRRSNSCCAIASSPTRGATQSRLTKGLNASPGAAIGRAVFDADDAVAWAARGERVVLVRAETSPDDFHGMAVAQGIVTARGGATSHAAVVARQIGKPCVAGCSSLLVDPAAKSARTVDSAQLHRGRRLAQRRWHDRRGLHRCACDGLWPLRGSAEACADSRLGGSAPPHGSVDQRRQTRGSGAGAPLRRAGDRPLPHRAHVPRR